MAAGQPPLFRQPRQSLGATRAAFAAAEQVAPIQQEQSLALIQESLSACIGTLAYIRGLFRADCFVLKRLGTAPNLQRQIPPVSQKPGGDAVSFLRPGVSLESDQLLEWLEKGIFRALRDGFLEALQLGIYLDQALPEQVVESYTFSFSYDHGLLVSDLSGKRVSLGDATRSAQQLTRSLLTLTNALPPLPGKVPIFTHLLGVRVVMPNVRTDIRWLNVRMHYRRGTPDDYDPPGFRRLEPGSNRLFFDLDDHSELVKQTCGSIDAGYYA
jgi:meiosis-specific protein HOP1